MKNKKLIGILFSIALIASPILTYAGRTALGSAMERIGTAVFPKNAGDSICSSGNRCDVFADTLDANLLELGGANSDINLKDNLLVGGVTTTSDLNFKTTTAVGIAGADVIFAGGNDGADEFMRILNSGDVGIGVADPDTQLEIFNAGNQLKLSFDATDNTTFGVDTNGDLTITPSGTKTIVAGDITISGDDLFMLTNTDKYLLVADGTNFNPVESTGDVVIANTGISTIQADSVALETDTTGDYISSITAGAGLSSTGATTGENISHTLSTASSEADFLASGALTCGASNQGKIQTHTTALQYCDNTATPVLRYASYGDSSGNALTGDSATAFFSSGTIEHEWGGLELNISSIGTGDVLAGASAGTIEIVDGGSSSDGDVFTIQADGTANWETPVSGGGSVTLLTASDVLKSSADTERSTTSETSILVKEIQTKYKGTIRVKFDIKSTSGTWGTFAQIYVNDIAVGTSRSDQSTTWVTFSEDIPDIEEGDKIQLYYSTSSTSLNTASTRNFRIYADEEVVSSDYSVNTD